MPKHHALLISLALVVGCKTGGQSQSVASHLPGPQESIAAADPPNEFSIRRAMELIGFSTESEEDSSVVPKEIVEMTAAVNTIVGRASELNSNDPPHVTAEKAHSIMDSLRPWDAAMAAAKSMGIVDDTTAQPLQVIVDQLRFHTQNLIQFGSQPETISAVQQLAGQLKSTLQGASSLFSQGSAALNAYNTIMAPATESR